MKNRTMSELNDLIQVVMNFDHYFMYSDSSSVRNAGYVSLGKVQHKVKEMDLNQDEHDYVINIIKIMFKYCTGKGWESVEPSDTAAVYKSSIENLLWNARN